MRNKVFMDQYPNLYISEDGHAVWVLRDGRDAESMGYEVTKADYSALNEEAGKALQEDWFYCSGCHTAKPRSEYSFFHFAGNYCKDCKEANPTRYVRAMSETYN
jgi:hypothetical protein